METDWIHIFTGPGPDNEWTADKLERVTKSYDVSYHEAPLTLGHPAGNDPALGWIAGLKREGLKLFARFRDVAPAFSEAWKARSFNKLSISIYRNLDGRGPYVRHVGALGATPPIIKGMAPAVFSEAPGADDFETFEFADAGGLDAIHPERSEHMFTKDQEKAMQDMIAAAVTGAVKPMQDTVSDFSEKVDGALERVSKLEQKPAGDKPDDGKNKEVPAEFSEKLAELGKQLEEAQALGKAATAELENTRLVQFCEGLVTDGRMLPANVAATVTTLKALDDTNACVEFAEGGKKSSITARAHHMQQLMKSPKVGPHTGELSGDGSGDIADFAEEEKREFYREHQAQFSKTFTEDQFVEFGKMPAAAH